MLLKRRPAGSDAKDEAATDDAHGIHAVPVHSAASAKPAAHPGKAPGKAPGEEAAARPIAQPAEHSAAGAVKPAACSPAPTGAELNACAVLGAKNEALRHELGQLEDKVKVLQVANGLTPAEESEAESLQEAQAKPKAAPRIHRKPKVEAPPEAPLPWLAIGGALAGVLALAGLALALLRRRRAKASQVLEQAREPEVVVLPQGGDEVADAGRPSLMSIIKARWTAMRSRKQGSQDAVEPSISQPE